ncbi:hypothetical protein F4804DRAFT_329946 [Jackrogersella minutella]|nr:hypothetical protein F4804DRAFT_329946 [Jackrogersella minutella]
MAHHSITRMACANWKDGEKTCPKEGTSACGSCRLVVYCGRDCQKEHWGEHKKDCNSPLKKWDWRPTWDREDRDPVWAHGEAATNIHNPFGLERHLWGNTPAMDVLALQKNEGLGYDKDLTLLFAASGDLRNMVKTIQNLPDKFKKQVNITLNDRDLGVVARNAVMLLLVLFTLEDQSDQTDIASLAETFMHVWYSFMIPGETIAQLNSKVKVQIQEVCEQIAEKKADALLAKTWQFKSGCTLRLVLKKKDWDQALAFLELPDHLDRDKAVEKRHAVVLAPERLDYRERGYFKDASLPMRVAKRRFHEDGMLLPFGNSRAGFDHVNPTLFQGGDIWLLDDRADPLTGWPIKEVKATPFVAAEDAYGRLLFHLRRVFSAFIRRLATGKFHFEFFNVDAKDLGTHVKNGTCDRVESSNITDICWLGTRPTLQSLSPLLKPPHQNRHATLITIYQNAVLEIINQEDQNKILDISECILYLTKTRVADLTTKPQGAEQYRIWDSRNLFFEVDNLFKKYMGIIKFDQIGTAFDVAMKAKNTIGDPWPTRLKLRMGQPGAQEEFDGILGSCWTGLERYVEWKRTK